MYSQLIFDADLIRRYESFCPHYASYPTAAQFHSGFNSAAYSRAALLSNLEAEKTLAIYVHVPFCASPCPYCRCSEIRNRDSACAAEYFLSLQREVELQAPSIAMRAMPPQKHSKARCSVARTTLSVRRFDD